MSINNNVIKNVPSTITVTLTRICNISFGNRLDAQYEYIACKIVFLERFILSFFFFKLVAYFYINQRKLRSKQKDT